MRCATTESRSGRRLFSSKVRGHNWLAALIGVGLALVLVACRSDSPANSNSKEMAYVAGSNVEFRSELGPETKVIGHLHSGDRVEILSRRPRWAEVRGATGQSGWVLQRSLVSQNIYDQFAKLYRETEVRPSQGRAKIRRDANLHLTPGRSTQVFYQLAENEEAEVVGHRAVPRGGEADAASETSSEEPPEGAPSDPTAPSPAPGDVATPDAAPRSAAPRNSPGNAEDWLLLRASRGRAGWVLETSADMDLPLEIAQYSEGLRIRAWFELYRENDNGEVHPWYLWATARSQGTSFDYDEIRVFVWDPKQHRYETSYRERGLNGFYPIMVGSEKTADGESPTFRLQVQGSDGNRFQKNYFMLGRQVRTAR